MKLSENLRVAVDLIKVLREVTDGEPRRVQDLAVKVRTTEDFLAKIVNVLRKHELVCVSRGPGGGVTATFRPVSMLEICNAFGYMTGEIEPTVGYEESDAVEVKLRDFLSGIEV